MLLYFLNTRAAAAATDEEEKVDDVARDDWKLGQFVSSLFQTNGFGYHHVWPSHDDQEQLHIRFLIKNNHTHTGQDLRIRSRSFESYNIRYEIDQDQEQSHTHMSRSPNPIYNIRFIAVWPLIMYLDITQNGRFPKISKVDKVLMCWWVFTGLTHIVLEGYFVFTPEFYNQKDPAYLAERSCLAVTWHIQVRPMMESHAFISKRFMWFDSWSYWGLYGKPPMESIELGLGDIERENKLDVAQTSGSQTDGSPPKRTRKDDDEQTSVQINFKSLSRKSKKKLEELLHQWSEWHAQECFQSEGSDEDLESRVW